MEKELGKMITLSLGRDLESPTLSSSLGDFKFSCLKESPISSLSSLKFGGTYVVG